MQPEALDRPILVVSHTAYLGGAERVLLRFLADQSGLEFVLLCPQGPLAEAARAAGLEVETSKALAPLSRRSNPLWPLKALGQLFFSSGEIIRLVRARGIRLLQANSYSVMPYLLIPAWVCKLPLVWHMHDFKPGTPLTVRRFGRAAAAVVAVSDAVKEALAAQGVERRKLVRIYNHIRPEHLSGQGVLPALESLRTWPIRIVGLMGSIEPRKGQLEALEALALSGAKDLHLVFAGAPQTPEQEEYAQSLIERTAALGLQGQVTWLGALSETAGFYRGLDLFLHTPAEPDPLPTVLLEALALGVPVAAYDSGGCPELLGWGRWGRLLPAGDRVALAQALKEPAPVLEPAERAALLEKFSLSAKEQAFSELYATLGER